MEIAGFHIPRYQGKIVRRHVGDITILLPDQTPEDIRRAADFVMEKRETILQKYSTADLAEIFGKVASYWQQPSEEKATVVKAIAVITGLSKEVVDRSITVEQGNSSTADILAALDRDLGDHRVLDGFMDDPQLLGKTKAWGPALVAAVLTANVPGLSYLPMVRSLMVKSPLVAKLSSSEPIFGPAWVKSLARFAPELADCVALFCWSGADPALEEGLFRPAPVVILYGGPKSIPRLREQIGPHKKILEHGHKIGVALIGKEKLDDVTAAEKLAKDLAYDVAMFDQRACIAPQIAYVETGGKVTTSEFAGQVGKALYAMEKELPAAHFSLDTAATLAQERNLAAFDGAQNTEKKVFTAGTATVVHEQELGFEGVLPTRYLRIYPVEHLQDVMPFFIKHGPYLQNVGIAVEQKRLNQLTESIGAAGASHITAIGKMHRPSMRWRHDGLAPFMEMVRWTDIEMMNKKE